MIILKLLEGNVWDTRTMLDLHMFEVLVQETILELMEGNVWDIRAMLDLQMFEV